MLISYLPHLIEQPLSSQYNPRLSWPIPPARIQAKINLEKQ